MLSQNSLNNLQHKKFNLMNDIKLSASSLHNSTLMFWPISVIIAVIINTSKKNKFLFGDTQKVRILIRR